MSTFLPSRALTRVILVVPLVLALGVSAFASTPASAAGLVTRHAGANRIATAVAISRATFAPGVRVVYVAEQSDLAYYLPAAAGRGSRRARAADGANVLPPNLANELIRLRPSRIIALGGTGHVSAVLSKLRRYSRMSPARLALIDSRRRSGQRRGVRAWCARRVYRAIR